MYFNRSQKAGRRRVRRSVRRSVKRGGRKSVRRGGRKSVRRGGRKSVRRGGSKKGNSKIGNSKYEKKNIRSNTNLLTRTQVYHGKKTNLGNKNSNRRGNNPSKLMTNNKGVTKQTNMRMYNKKMSDTGGKGINPSNLTGNSGAKSLVTSAQGLETGWQNNVSPGPNQVDGGP